MIDQVAMMSVVEKHRRDAVVVLVYQAAKGWAEVTKNPLRDLSVGGSMGKASSFALGLALAQPQVRVILFDGDGSLEMNLGTLITIAAQRPKNLYHFVIQNGVYATTGGQPIPGDGMVSFADMAKAAGYPVAHYYDDLETFTTSIGGVLKGDGPALICVRTKPEIRLPEERATQRAAAGRRPISVAVRDLQKDLGAA